MDIIRYLLKDKSVLLQPGFLISINFTIIPIGNNHIVLTKLKE